MRWNNLLMSFLATVLLPCCNVFLPDIGGMGEQCSDNSSCMDDLVCNFNECGPPRGLGEECDEIRQNNEWPVCEDGMWCIDSVCVETGGEGQPCFYYSEWDAEVGCDDGLHCINGTCTGPLPDTVQQPGSNKIWTRCPVGMQWIEWECTGTATDLLWSDVLSSCPSGFQVPSLNDFIQIFADCDSSVINHSVYGGKCDSCSESPKCDEIFTNDPTNSGNIGGGEVKSETYWTRTVGKVIDEVQYAFMIDFDGGYDCVETVANPDLSQALVLCIKY